MLFNSYRFLFLFLPVVLILSRRLKGTPLLFALTTASYLFYARFGSAWFLIPLIATTCFDFSLAQLIEKAEGAHRKRLFLLSIGTSLGLLVYLKYSGLILSTGAWLSTQLGAPWPGAQWAAWFGVLLPAGISFYTFQTLSYVIDVYRGQAKAERHFWTFAAFISFFPHLVAGPLTRHHQLIPQLERIAREGVRPRWSDGIFLFAIGLCKKVLVADRLADVIDPLLNGATPLSFPSAWLCLAAYGLQIYFDFSGYSDMAIGLGRLFGVELPQNFDRPYQALNPSDFWRRWHMTLSAWLRDYLYIPLGGSRGSPLFTARNLFITMALGGLWHGAHWTFLLWGMYHGVLLALYHVARPMWDRLWKPLQRFLTLALVLLGWVFFRSPTASSSLLWFEALFKPMLRPWDAPTWSFEFWTAFGVGALVSQLVSESSASPQLGAMRPLRQFGLGIATAIALLYLNYPSVFLYYQF